LKRRRSNRIADIGLSLFDLYSNTLRIADNGYAIINALTCDVSRHKYYYESGVSESSIRAVDSFADALGRRVQEAKAVFKSFNNLRPLVDIAEASATQAAHASLFEDDAI
jgi:hypothetical protein